LEEEEGLTMETFKLPQKVVGTDRDFAQMALAFEKMLKDNPGRSLDDVLKSAALKCPPGEDESMEIDGANKKGKEPDKSVAVAGDY
jgi:hypothetical protein